MERRLTCPGIFHLGTGAFASHLTTYDGGKISRQSQCNWTKGYNAEICGGSYDNNIKASSQCSLTSLTLRLWIWHCFCNKNTKVQQTQGAFCVWGSTSTCSTDDFFYVISFPLFPVQKIVIFILGGW